MTVIPLGNERGVRIQRIMEFIPDFGTGFHIIIFISHIVFFHQGNIKLFEILAVVKFQTGFGTENFSAVIRPVQIKIRKFRFIPEIGKRADYQMCIRDRNYIDLFLV